MGFLSIVFSVESPASSSRSALLDALASRVSVERAGVVSHVTVERVVGSGDTVRTDASGSALITYPDGSTAMLDPESELTIDLVRADGGDLSVRLQHTLGRVRYAPKRTVAYAEPGWDERGGLEVEQLQLVEVERAAGLDRAECRAERGAGHEDERQGEGVERSGCRAERRTDHEDGPREEHRPGEAERPADAERPGEAERPADQARSGEGRSGQARPALEAGAEARAQTGLRASDPPDPQRPLGEAGEPEERETARAEGQGGRGGGEERGDLRLLLTDHELRSERLVDLAQIRLGRRVVVLTLGELGDLLERHLIERGTDLAALDADDRPLRAAHADRVDAHAAARCLVDGGEGGR